MTATKRATDTATRTTTGRRRRAVRTGTAALIAGAVASGALAAAPAQARDRDRDARGGGHAVTQRAVEAMVAGGVPGVTVTASDADGVWKSAAGTGDLRTGKKRGANDRFRVASIHKTWVWG
ncbi:alkaline D-peptidase, partial [Streptomyces sp. NPDC058953]